MIDQQITEEEGHTELVEAGLFAQAELAKRLTPPKRVTCTTRIPGHYPLLTVPMDFPDRLVTGDYLVAETRIRHTTIDENSDEQPLFYELVLWEGDSLGESWIQYFRGRNPSQGIRWGACRPARRPSSKGKASQASSPTRLRSPPTAHAGRGQFAGSCVCR